MGLTAIPGDIPIDALEVYIQGNSITTFEADVFSHLSECTILELSFNGISVVEPGAFEGLTALTYLEFRSNSLDRLYVNMFSNLTSCTGIDLQNNAISEIELGSFDGLSNVRDPVFLNGNRLTTLRAGTFQGFVNVENINLFGYRINSIEDNTFANLKNLKTL